LLRASFDPIVTRPSQKSSKTPGRVKRRFAKTGRTKSFQGLEFFKMKEGGAGKDHALAEVRKGRDD